MFPFPPPMAWPEPPKRPVCGRSECGRQNSRLNSRFRRLSPRAIRLERGGGLRSLRVMANWQRVLGVCRHCFKGAASSLLLN